VPERFFVVVVLGKFARRNVPGIIIVAGNPRSFNIRE
jgi:hypothetical protein